MYILGSSARYACTGLDYEDICWLLCYSSYIMEDILRQMCYGRYITAEVLWKISYG